MKIGIDNGGNWTAEYYEATVVSVVDYYPFGSAMAGRKYNQGSYRYGFNGKEEDKEWGSQMIQDYGFRIYNPTIGKFLSVDPLMKSYPYYTPYQFAGNKPIWKIDLDGLEEANTGAGDDEYDFQAVVTGKTKSGNFKLGYHKFPQFKHDDGHLEFFEPREPTLKERGQFLKWFFISRGAFLFWWKTGNGTRAYIHFRTGDGEDYEFDAEDYYQDDANGKRNLNMMINEAKAAAVDLAGGEADATFLMTSGVYTMQRDKETEEQALSNGRMVYPATEDWQKAIGGHLGFLEATVSTSRIESTGELQYTMKLTAYLEDKYNFDPGKVDIGSGTPDSENGIFEITGLATQFMQYGKYTTERTWTESDNTTTNPVITEDVERF